MARVRDAWREAWLAMPEDVRDSPLTMSDGSPSKRAYSVVFPTVFKDSVPARLRRYENLDQNVAQAERDIIVGAAAASAGILSEYVNLLGAVREEFRRQNGHADPNHDMIFPLARDALKSPGHPWSPEAIQTWARTRVAKDAGHSHADAPFQGSTISAAFRDPQFVARLGRRLSQAWGNRSISAATLGDEATETVLRGLPVTAWGAWAPDHPHPHPDADTALGEGIDRAWDVFLQDVERASAGNLDALAAESGLVRDAVRQPDVTVWRNDLDIPALDMSLRQRCDATSKSVGRRGCGELGTVAEVAGWMADSSVEPLAVTATASRATLVIGFYQALYADLVTGDTGPGSPGSLAMANCYLRQKTRSSGPATEARRRLEDGAAPAFVRKLWVRLVAGELRGREPLTVGAAWALIFSAWQSVVRHALCDMDSTFPELELSGDQGSGSDPEAEAVMNVAADRQGPSRDRDAVVIGDLAELSGLAIESGIETNDLLGRIFREDSSPELRHEYQDLTRAVSRLTGQRDWPSYHDALSTIKAMGRDF